MFWLWLCVFWSVLVIAVFVYKQLRGKKGVVAKTDVRFDLDRLALQEKAGKLIDEREAIAQILDCAIEADKSTITVYGRQFSWKRMATIAQMAERSAALKRRLQLVGAFVIKDDAAKTDAQPLPEICDTVFKHALRSHIVFKPFVAMTDRLDNYVYLFTARIKHQDTVEEYVIRVGGTQDFQTRMSQHQRNARKDEAGFRPGRVIAHMLISNPRSCVRVYAVRINVDVRPAADEDLISDEDLFVSAYANYESDLTKKYTSIVTSQFDDLADYEKRPLLCIKTPVIIKRRRAE